MKLKLFHRTLTIVLLLVLSTSCSAQNLVNPPPADPPAPGDSGDTGEVLTCYHANNYVLSFDHTLTVNEQETSLTHILKQGNIALLSETNPDDFSVTITTASPQELSFEYMGVLGPCSVA